jgi:hypothetical protein
MLLSGSPPKPDEVHAKLLENALPSSTIPKLSILDNHGAVSKSGFGDEATMSSPMKMRERWLPRPMPLVSYRSPF